MDASGMVKMAQNWQNVGPQVITSVKAVKVPVMVSSMNSVSTKLEVTDHGDVNFLENVQVGMYLVHSFSILINLSAGSCHY